MTDRFRFLHAADLHLDSPLRGLDRYEGAPVEAIRDATRRAFDNLVQCAIDEAVAFVVLAGDVFDGEWRDYGTGLFFASGLRRLGAAGIRVYLLTGNHDAAAVMTRHLELPPNVNRFPVDRPATLRDESTGTVLHGQGFAERAVKIDLAADYPPAIDGAFNVGVLHTALEGREGHDHYAPCTLATLLSKNYDYWALGHVHAREVVWMDPWVVFPGNLQARNVRECGSKGASLVEVQEQRVVRVEHRALDVLRFAQPQLDAAGATSFDAVLDRADRLLAAELDRAEGRLLAVRVHVVGRSAAHAALRRDADRLRAELRNRANSLGDLWLESVRVATTPEVPGAGEDLREALALDDAEVQAATLAAAMAEVGSLLGAVHEDGEEREAMLSEALTAARELVIERLLDTAAHARAGDGA